MLDDLAERPVDSPVRWPQPGELWSLWDMVEVFHSIDMINVGLEISRAEEAYVDDEMRAEDEYGNFVLNEEGWAKVSVALRRMAYMSECLERPDMAIEFGKNADSETPLHQEAFYVALGFFRQVLYQTQMLLLTSDARKHYGKMHYFGEAVLEAFPTAAPEIKDCGNCFGLGQYTAAVFHALRAIEVPLVLMAQEFGVTKFKNWNDALNELEGLVRDRANPRNVPDWDAKKDFYTDAINHLFAMKNAWRNYTMHLKLRFEREEAEEVIYAARAFMRKASKVVSE